MCVSISYESGKSYSIALNLRNAYILFKRLKYKPHEKYWKFVFTNWQQELHVLILPARNHHKYRSHVCFVIISEVKILDFIDVAYIQMLEILSLHYKTRLPTSKYAIRVTTNASWYFYKILCLCHRHNKIVSVN